MTAKKQFMATDIFMLVLMVFTAILITVAGIRFRQSFFQDFPYQLNQFRSNEKYNNGKENSKAKSHRFTRQGLKHLSNCLIPHKIKFK